MIFLICSFLTLTTLPIHGTVANSSEVAFILQTPVSFDTVSHGTEDFIRFANITVADSVGYPEVPMITCFVAVPDGVDPELEWSVTGEVEHSDFPVYPVPAQVISYEYTQQVLEEFRQDSSAYASSEWWPAERVRVIGETRICDQRLIQLQIFPVQFRASDNAQSIVSAVSVAITFDSTQVEWSSIGLGPFQDMVEGSPIVGYHSVEQSDQPFPEYFNHFDIVEGPERMPDYLILAASGLYDQCGNAIDDLAEHRVALNQYDVALVTTNQVLDAFGDEATELTPGIIRDFTEHMWDNWGNGITKPSYLLLIGDHEDISFAGEPWFLPTHEYKWSGPGGSTDQNWVGNDEWYAYFNHPRTVNNAFPDMIVGRLSVKNSTDSDTLSVMIGNIIDLEQHIQGIPIEDHRRRIVRLAGKGEDDDDDEILFLQHYFDWAPKKEWTADLCSWLGYDYSTHYCGDGRWFTSQDGSRLKSIEYRKLCLDEFSGGSGVLFYSNHGDFHMFGAGLEWDPHYCPFANKGAPDSTVNCINTRLVEESEYYSAPFVLMLCCGAGTFNHTEYLHTHRESHLNFCLEQTIPPFYDFSTDCLAEVVHKNNGCPSAGVFCGALSSYINNYSYYGCGILEAIYAYGHGRIGDSVADARLQYLDYFTAASGQFKDAMGQFNLLGDPALDITDRVRYPDKCDLVVYSDELICSEYPRETAGGFEEEMSFTVRNSGGSFSGSFDLEISVSDGNDTSTETISCGSLAPGEELVCDYVWTASWFSPPSSLTVTVHADPTGQCDDSWIHNNVASVELQLNDIYPFEDGWPIGTKLIVGTTPLLINIDSDPYLEVVAAAGSRLCAWNHFGILLWSNDSHPVKSSIPPLAADFDGDGEMEIAAINYTGSEVCLFDGDGVYIGSAALASVNRLAAADMHPNTGIELVAASGGTICLYEWDTDHFSLLDSKTFKYEEIPNPVSLACRDLNGDSYAETVFYSGWADNEFPQDPAFYSLAVYDWAGQQVLSNQTWILNPGDSYPLVALFAGELDETPLIGFPQGRYDVSSLDTHPAWLVVPDGSTIDECERSTLSAHSLKYGMFADWDPGILGADAFVLPSETQCFAWDDEGKHLLNWPADFSGDTLGKPVCPPALGNLDGIGFADVLTGTVLDGYWQALAYDRYANELEALGFPIILPGCVSGLGGFAVADIDRDGKVEVVFGSDDGLLQCWELGNCPAGYAPWPQYQCDCGRSGELD